MGRLILTVDDSASVRQLVAFTLRSASYDVLEAFDGQEAVSKLSENIQLIVRNGHSCTAIRCSMVLTAVIATVGSSAFAASTIWRTSNAGALAVRATIVV